MFPISRRRLLEALGIGGAASVAGCTTGLETEAVGQPSTTLQQAQKKSMEQVAADSIDISAPIDRTEPKHHGITLEAKEVTAEIEDGVMFNFMKTTIVWEWNGEGGSHDVVAEDDSFESEMQSDQGATFEQSFDKQGVTKYYCEPHRAMGMKGAIVVSDATASLDGNTSNESTGTANESAASSEPPACSTAGSQRRTTMRASLTRLTLIPSR